MYLPYLRGKQYELLAVKEMAEELASSGKIQVIIEPVRRRTDALERCLDELVSRKVPTTLLLNPAVGEFANDSGAYEELVAVFSSRAGTAALRPGIIVRAATPVTAIHSALSSHGIRGIPVDFVHTEFAKDQDISKVASDGSLHIGNSKEVVRRYNPEPDGENVKLTDRFVRRRNNLEYVDAPTTLFTDDNRYFTKDGYFGFSDFATIGEEYQEGGSSPRALVIHLTYRGDDGAIWIEHLASESNEDTADVAGKFGEAVEKVVAFADRHGMSNKAIEAFRRHKMLGTYPGLGMIKKLSIQNHLYVMMDALS